MSKSCPDIETCSREGIKIHVDWYKSFCCNFKSDGIKCHMYERRHRDPRELTPKEWSEQK
jgi:hypothetical protein